MELSRPTLNGQGFALTKLERVIDVIPGDTYPRLVEAVGRCPPKDVGGWPGYEEFLQAINNPKHERHAEMIQWTGLDRFDPTIVHPEIIADELAALAKRWARKPRSKPARKA